MIGKSENVFHVILFYQGNQSLLKKNEQIINRQYLSKYVIHIVVDNQYSIQFKSEFGEEIAAEKWIVHCVNGNALEDISLLADVIKRIPDGWICFLKPDDEWMPYHLTAMNDATEQCFGEKFFNTQNAGGSLKCIKQPILTENRIDFSNVDFNEYVSLSQMMIHHSVAQTVLLPGLWFESHSDLMVKLAFMKTFSLQRINRFTCVCKPRKKTYSRNYFDQLILTMSYAVRNLIADNSLRMQLMSKAYRSSVLMLMRRMKLMYSFILLSEMMCCMSGLRKGMKGGMANVD